MFASQHSRFKLSFSAICFLFFCAGSATARGAETLNSKINYIHDGKPVSGWGIVLGDPASWYTPVNNGTTAASASGKVSISPTDRTNTGDALKISWDKKNTGKGVFALYGSPIDLSNLENDAALMIDLRVDQKPNKNVTIGMDCGYPCKGEVHVIKYLKSFNVGEWNLLPIPLNCLTKEGLDLKKTNGSFVISTEGKLDLSISSVQIIKLPEGEKGCAK